MLTALKEETALEDQVNWVEYVNKGNAGLQYSTTNEPPGAFLRGLRPQEGDRIISICGSGDQPFLFAALGAEVVAIDTNPVQIEFANKRAEALRAGSFSGFRSAFPIDHYGSRVQDLRDFYFRPELAEKFLEGLDRITLVRGDILMFAGNTSGHNKLYLSNAIEHIQEFTPTSKQELASELQLAVDNMPEGGVIYTTDKRWRNSLFSAGYGLRRWSSKEGLPIELDKEVSKDIRHQDIFSRPRVYVKK